MVKPPKTMQPEAVDLVKLDKKGTRGIDGDNFRNYMARKIDLQRKQFGLVLPPDPIEQPRRKQVRFADDVAVAPTKKRKVKDMSTLLKRLKKRHGTTTRRKRSKTSSDQQESSHSQGEGVARKPQHEEESVQEEECQSQASSPKESPASRKDLFFFGVVVLVNGFTVPDNDTLRRMLHKHGGDLETYETTRITHIIAQNLSTAKANMYKRQRKPKPVVRPDWIVDSVKAGRLLPHADYLIPEVQLEATSSVKSFFTKEPLVREENKGILKMNQEKKAPTSGFASIPPAQSAGADQEKSVAHTEVGDSCGGSAVDSGCSAASVVSDDDPLNSGKPSFQREQPVTTMDAENEAPMPEPNQSDIGDAAHNESAMSKTSGATFIDGRTRTVGTDPNFLDSFFSSSRLSFIGSFKQRARQSPTKKVGKHSKSSQQRFVFLVDMDSFFASVVLRNFPQYRDKPVAISHMGKKVDNGPTVNPTLLGTKDSTSECATCNYEARKYGVKKGMFLGRARELCPDLVVLHYDFEGYEEVSEQVADILQRVADEYDGIVEQVSCDEAYVELFLSTENVLSTSDELAWNIAEDIRKAVLDTTQCTATVGVAANKLLAKLAVDKAKPNNVMVVKDPRALLEPLKLRDLHGIGYRMERKLTAENLESVRDVWELGAHAESELIRILGPGLGKKIQLFCEGEDGRPVKPMERKTIGAECNYGVRFDGPYGVDYMVEGLAKEVQKRMAAVGVKGSRITLKVKQRKQGAKPPPKFLGHGSCHNLSKSADTFGGTPTQDWSTISRIGLTLLEQLSVSKDDIRGMGIVISKLVSDKASPIDSEPSNRITSWFGDPTAKTGEPMPSPTDDRKRAAQATVAMDSRNGKVSSDSPEQGTTETHLETLSQKDFILNPRMSQIDMSFLESLPSDIRTEIEGQLAGYNVAQDAGNDEAAARPRMCLSPIVLSQNEQSQPFSQDTPPQNTLEDWQDDLALPSFSQIHMSQVAALPSPLRSKIISKISSGSCDDTPDDMEAEIVEEASSKADIDSAVGTGRIYSKETREDGDVGAMKQLSLKRMMKLAAVKSGQDKSLATTLGGSVSLTQLECLPLEMQLQVVNNDEVETRRRNTGSVSSRNRRKSAPVPKPETKESASCSKVNEPVEVAMQAHVTMGAANHHSAPLLSEQPSFYQENIAPFKKYMNENPNVPDAALERVRDFLLMCVTERRFVDVTKLLRSMKYRGDEWSGPVYQEILTTVDERARALLGRPLDLHGLGL